LTIIEDRHSCPQFEEQMGDIIRYSNILILNTFTVKYVHINLDLRIKE